MIFLISYMVFLFSSLSFNSLTVKLFMKVSISLLQFPIVHVCFLTLDLMLLHISIMVISESLSNIINIIITLGLLSFLFVLFDSLLFPAAIGYTHVLCFCECCIIVDGISGTVSTRTVEAEVINTYIRNRHTCLPFCP